jgi:hypothetical protein
MGEKRLRARWAALALCALAPMVQTDLATAAPNPVKAAFPAQWSATNGDSPASRSWALLIGITKYESPTRNTIGGRRDVLEIKAHLRSLGWRNDHILVVTDEKATKPMILGAINWLKWKAQSDSLVVFAYSGHEMPFSTSADGDNEERDVALHTTENKFILDGDLARRLGGVKSSAMWLHFATCRAAGFNDAGLMKGGRIATFSSPDSSLSYEDPDVGLSVMNHYQILQGMRQELADRNGDGVVTVEESFKFGKPRVKQRTAGRQVPIIVDRLGGGLSLRPGSPII